MIVHLSLECGSLHLEETHSDLTHIIQLRKALLACTDLANSELLS